MYVPVKTSCYSAENIYLMKPMVVLSLPSVMIKWLVTPCIFFISLLSLILYFFACKYPSLCNSRKVYIAV